MDKKNRQLGVIHRFIPSNSKEAKSRMSLATLLLLHGAGRNEEDLIPLGHEISSKEIRRPKIGFLLLFYQMKTTNLSRYFGL
jgi:predicted esterase